VGEVDAHSAAGEGYSKIPYSIVAFVKFSPHPPCLRTATSPTRGEVNFKITVSRVQKYSAQVARFVVIVTYLPAYYYSLAQL
jgi:hypothetical protein